MTVAVAMGNRVSDYDVVIIGAGAAGLMCAIRAGQRGRRVIILESSHQIAGKIRISGGGRCNFTNRDVGPENFLSRNPRFCLSALRGYGPQDFVALLDCHNIAYQEKDHGQLFCVGKAGEIIDMLCAEAAQAGVVIRTGCPVTDSAKTDHVFTVQAADNLLYRAPSLVIACGGKSIPKMGASGFGYHIAQQFGHGIIPPEPALVPFTFQGPLLERLKSLAGVAVPRVTVHHGKIRFTEALLFTHRGLSGPAILQISSYWHPGDLIRLDLSPDCAMADFLKTARRQQPKMSLLNLLARRFPRRLVQFMADMIDLDGGQRLAELSNEQCARLAEFIHNWQIQPSGTEGFRTAEVTRGGVDTRDISSKTFESRKVPGLYFIGEVLDVTGHLGGYNFQWAWASAQAAGRFV